MTIITTTKHVFSGVCICGHNVDHHHGNMIMRPSCIELMVSYTYFGECEYFGCNESWQPCPKCFGFIDKDDPLKQEKINYWLGKA